MFPPVNCLSLLPAELIVLVLEELPYTDLLRCERVCRQFYKLIRESASLQYKIELAIAGMRDISRNKLSKAAKRDRLARHTRAYKRWPEHMLTKQTIPLLEGPLWELCGGVLAQSDGRRDLDFWQLPSKIRGIPPREWGVDVDFDIADFTLDPSQDLLVAVEVDNLSCMAHLLCLSTGGPHPLAAVQHLPFPLPPFDIPNRSYHLRICGDYVGILIHVFDITPDEPHTVFGVTNWKTGQSKMLTAHWGILSFAFLDTEHLVLLRSVDRDSDIAPNEILSPIVVVTVVNFAKPVASNDLFQPPNCPNITLRLPTIADRWEIWHAEVVCDPAPGCEPSIITSTLSNSTTTTKIPASASGSSKGRQHHHAQQQQQQEPTAPPFHISPADRVIVIRINGVDTLFEQGDAIDIFILASSLVTLLRVNWTLPAPQGPPLHPHPYYVTEPFYPNSDNTFALPLPPLLLLPPSPPPPRRESLEMVWETWGPSLTRVLPAMVPACVWCYPAYGTRFAGQSDGYVTIFDFNPIAVRKAVASSPSSSPLPSSSSTPSSTSSSPPPSSSSSSSSFSLGSNSDDGSDVVIGVSTRGGTGRDVGIQVGGSSSRCGGGDGNNDNERDDFDGGETVTQPGGLSRQFFEGVVKSSLPYRKFKTTLKMDPGQFVMINEDSVLLVKEYAKEFRISSL